MKIKILVVEDEPITALSIKKQLEAFGFDVPAIAYTGQEAIEKVTQIRPNIVFMDIVLKGDINGIETARKIQEFSDVPIIYLTAYSDNEMLEIAKETAPYFYLTKPFDPKELRIAVEIATYKYQMEKQLKSAFEDASIGMALVSFQGKFLKTNKALSSLLGFSKEELLQINVKEISHIEDEQNEKAHKNDLFEGNITSYHFEKRFLSKTKEWIWTLVHTSLSRDTAGTPLYHILQIQDISDRKFAEAKLLNLANYDLLSGLPNRKLIEELLNQSLLMAKVENKKTAILCLSLDLLKYINETTGRLIGDMLIHEFAKRLASNIRLRDLVGRWDGNDFLVILSTVSGQEEALEYANKLLHAIKEPFNIGDRKFFLTASLGLAVYPDAADFSQNLISYADIAMNQARVSGGDTIKVFDYEMLQKIEKRIRIENSLRTAFKFNEFSLRYQPIVSVDTGKIISIEVLLRWDSKELGEISPALFIPVAESSDLICLIGEWVFEHACASLANLKNELGFAINFSVNISVRQLKETYFIEMVERHLNNFGIDPTTVALEITEGQLMLHFHECALILNKLKEKGIKILLDDFGVGYSSFDYLRKFSFDRFKIDKTFVHHVSCCAGSATILAGIIAMSHTLGVKTVAEGIETAEDLECLKQIKCDEAQGYYFSKALTYNEIKQFFSQKEQKEELKGQVR